LNCNSQDEKVLLDTLQDKYGFKLISRTTDTVEIEMNGEVETWKIIKLNEFSSDRKMMSIVVRREEDDVLMSYVKGADMAVYM
jgi:magnesium-transporting ATPase (P-type)